MEQRLCVSPGLIARQEQVIALRQGGLQRIEAAVSPRVFAELEQPAREIIRLVPARLQQIETALRSAATIALPLQPSIRDLRADHFLFEGDTLTGIVDFGSLRIESPVGDVARALGSLVGDNTQLRNTALAAYEAVRPLSENERLVLPTFDHSEVLLSAVNWLDWIYCQQRHFDNPAAVLARVKVLLQRLHCLPSQGDFV